MLQKLDVLFMNDQGDDASLSIVASNLEKLEQQPLRYAPWSDQGYRPEVSFVVSYSNHSLFLQFNVKENFIRAACGSTNDPVYQDSCVEFFASFDKGASYYNFEFNCIGTILGGYGKERNGRVPLAESLLGQVRSHVLIRREGGNRPVSWQLTVELPFEVFQYHPLTSLRGKQCRANFYKCGDELPEPHYLCWSEIKSQDPDFHLPSFFGTLAFK